MGSLQTQRDAKASEVTNDGRDRISHTMASLGPLGHHCGNDVDEQGGNTGQKADPKVKELRTPKARGRQFVSVDPSKCTGCGICEYVCSLEKEGFPNPLGSRIRVVRLSRFLNLAMVCRFCKEAPCASACSRGALKQSESGGVLVVDEDKCDVCGWCLQACPYGGIASRSDESVVVACDLCDGKPKCVEFCPEEALELATDDEASQKTLISALERIPSETRRLADKIEQRALAEVFAEAEKRARRFEEKLEALNARVIEATKR